MASQPIATVVAVTGKAFARNENLELRALKAGDTLLEGETIITSADSRVELSFMDGSTMEVAADQTMLMATDLFESGRSDAAESALADTTTEQILQALAEGRDIDTALEAPAAGIEGGTGGEGNSFVRLLRIVEEVDPLAFAFEGTAGTEPPVFDEGLIVEEPVVVEEDDTPTADPMSSEVDETGGLNSITASLGIDFGNDGPGSVVLSAVGATWDDISKTLIADDGSWQAVVNSDGTYTFTQLQAMDHPVAGSSPADHNDPILINITATVTDSDGDSVSKTFVITVLDDGPSASLNGEATLDVLTLDESALPTAGDGLRSTTANFADNFATTINYGTDGAGSVSYALHLSAVSVGSGLYALDPADISAGDGDGIGQGAEIMLSKIGNDIVGKVGDTTYFTISVNSSTGVVTFAQSNNIWHDNIGDNDEAATLATAAGNLVLTQTVTDADGDTAMANLDLGSGVFKIEDDGPSAFIVPTGTSMTLDETLGAKVGDANAAADDNVSANPFTVAWGTPIGLLSGVDLVDTTTTTGADGGTTAVTLSIVGGAGVLSGLKTTNGTDIALWQELDGTVTGRTGGENGTVIFAISINGAGEVTVAQYSSLQHPTYPNSYDEAVDLSGKLNAVVTVTDGDGDVASASVAIGNAIRFEDDGPSVVIADHAVLQNGAGLLPVTFGLDFDNSLLNNYGADGGTVRFPASLGTTPSGLTSNGVAITYVVSSDGLILTGMAGATSVFVLTLNPATATYTVDMNATVDSISTVNFSDGSYDFVGSNTAWAGFVPDGQGFGEIPVNDDSRDLLLTPFGTATTINGNANSAGAGGGAGGQNIGAGEGVRLDFVVDLGGNPAGAGGYTVTSNRDHTFDSHYIANGASLKFGDGKNNTVLQITARDETTTTDTNNVVGDGILDSVTSVVISYDGMKKTVTFANIGTTATAFVVGNPGGLADRTYTVQFVDVDPSAGVQYAVRITGILDTNVSIATFTANGYSSLEILNTAGDDFAITGFGAAVQSTNPFNFSVPVEVIDGDGDIAGSMLGVTLTQAGAGIQDYSTSVGAVTATSTLASSHIIGSDFDDTLTGDAANNVLSGGPGNDTLTGGLGNDIMAGGAGSDTLDGGAGNDTLFGGAGNDNLTGGTGADTFKWSLGDASGGAHDRITDFKISEGDALDLKDLLVGENSTNLNNFLTFIKSGSDTVLTIDTNSTITAGGDTQIITFVNTDLFNQAGTAENSAALIAKLLADGNLKTDM